MILSCTTQFSVKKSKMELVAKTLFGLENVLAGELTDLGAQNVRVLNRAVSFEGDNEMMYRVNYCCRTALSVLKPVGRFRIGTAKDIYYRALKIKWDEIFDLEQTFAIVPVVHSNLFNHTGYAGLVLKDAIADFFTRKYNLRPSVDTARPDILFNLHISENDVTISLDSSGIPLYKRGYRISQTIAPLNEVLAAGIVMISGWNGTIPLFDPMCGSGTIPIEAVMIANRIPPGKFRKSYGFMKWKDFDNNLFKKVTSEADSKVEDNDIEVLCADILPEAVSCSTLNISSAGLSSRIKLLTRDFFSSGSGGKNYVIITNPPYGERLKEDDINDFYSRIGERLKHGYEGSSAWIITGNTGALKFVGLKPSVKYTLFNGPIETRLVRYDLYSGSLKRK